jgi:outer membrane lipoprotein-sorting protein
MKTFSAALALALAVPAAAVPTPDEIVAKADDVRNPRLDYTLDVRVSTSRPDEQAQNGRFEVLVKGRDRTVVKTLAPAMSRGRTLLMRGRDLWAFLPDASQPVRITLQQRLMGSVSNGDLARANLAGDYAAKLLREENGAWVLDLTAKHEDLTYHRIVYWVSQKDFRPVKAQFFALSGKLLKECSYEGWRELGGAFRPTKLVIADAVIKGRVSVIEYDGMRVSPLAEKLFAKDHLKKLKY